MVWETYYGGSPDREIGLADCDRVVIGVDYTEMVCMREESVCVWGKRVETEDREVAVTHVMTVVEGKSDHIHCGVASLKSRGIVVVELS